MVSTQGSIPELTSESTPKLATEVTGLDECEFGPMKLVVVQPTSFCNLDCDYCYLPDRHLKKTMSLDLIEPIVQRIVTSQFFRRDVTICWHAGEPLAATLPFYEAAFDRIAEANHQFNQTPFKIDHSIQTNGILINQAWCDFFKQHDIHVGVSLDGPDFLHDRHRKTRTGVASHASVMRGIAHLQRNEIPFSVISVITEDSLDYADELFNFFVENKITDVGFNMEETEGIHQASSLDRDKNATRYRNFMQRFWELTTQTDGAFKLREFEVICELIYANSRIDHTDMNKPFVIVSIDHQGNFSTFDPELLSVQTDRYGDFVFGNILHNSFEDICKTPKFQDIYRDMAAGVQGCQASCEYFGVCGGGAGSNKYWENGTFNSTATKACNYRTKVVTDLVLDALESSFV